MINLDKNKKYMVAVSGGADSMCLLDNARKHNLNIIVGHVNYKKRVTADRDQKIVEDYCQKYNIPLFIHIAKNHEGNFQNGARIERYQFFNQIMKENGIDYLLVAHQLDDALETYLFKKKRNSFAENLSIQKETEIFGIKVIRPLLNYYRQDLRNYCLNNNINFGDDESNFTLDYERNRIRLLILNNLTIEQKNDLVKKMNQENMNWIEKNKKISDFYNKNVSKMHYSYEAYKSLDNSLKGLFLYYYFKKNLNKSLNHKRIEEIMKAIESKPNIDLEIYNSIFTRAYDDIYLHSKNIINDYCYQINNYDLVETPYFKIKKEGPTNYGIYVDESDFPLTIRNYKKGDFVKMKEYNKDVNRLFIDRKISKEKRKTIPIILNNKNEIILIPGIYRIYERKLLRSNIFVV